MYCNFPLVIDSWSILNRYSQLSDTTTLDWNTAKMYLKSKKKTTKYLGDQYQI